MAAQFGGRAEGSPEADVCITVLEWGLPSSERTNKGLRVREAISYVIELAVAQLEMSFPETVAQLRMSLTVTQLRVIMTVS